MADNGFKINKSANFNPQSGAPANPIDGDFYYDSTAQSFAYYHNGSWANFDSVGTVSTALWLTGAQFTPAIVRNSVVKVTGGVSTAHLAGISASFSAKRISIYNAGSALIVVEPEDANEPTANNRIQTPTGGSMNLVAGEIAVFTYDITANRWLLVSISSQAGAQAIATTSSPGIVTLHQASLLPLDGVVLSDGDLNTANGVVGLDANRAASIIPSAGNTTALLLTGLGSGAGLFSIGGTTGHGIVSLRQNSVTSTFTNPNVLAALVSVGTSTTFATPTGDYAGIFGGNVDITGNLTVGPSTSNQFSVTASTGAVGTTGMISLDTTDSFNGTWSVSSKTLHLGNGSGEGIASKRTIGGPNYLGLSFYTDSTERMYISNAGDGFFLNDLSVGNDLTVTNIMTVSSTFATGTGLGTTVIGDRLIAGIDLASVTTGAYTHSFVNDGTVPIISLHDSKDPTSVGSSNGGFWFGHRNALTGEAIINPTLNIIVDGVVYSWDYDSAFTLP